MNETHTIDCKLDPNWYLRNGCTWGHVKFLPVSLEYRLSRKEIKYVARPDRHSTTETKTKWNASADRRCYMKMYKKYTVSQRNRVVRSSAHNFDKCQPSFKISSLLHSDLNLQQTDYSFPTTPETCSYFTLHNQGMLILLLYKHTKCKRMRF